MKVIKTMRKTDGYRLMIKIYEPETEVKGFIVGVHGFGGSMHSLTLEKLAKVMTEHGYAVITFNFPGHGTSGADIYFNVRNCCMDFEEVFEFAGYRYPRAAKKAIFATSYGGYITLQCMDSLPPETRIVLRAPAVNAHETFCRLLDMEDEDLLDLPAPEAFLRELEEKDVFHKYFNRPMLLIQGDRDELVTHEEAMVFCKHNPQAVLEIVEGLGHQITNDAENDTVIAIAEKYLLAEEV